MASTNAFMKSSRSIRARVVFASRCFGWFFLAWLVMVGLPSLREVRAWLIAPLYRHDESASGEAAYVMADGSAYWERLRAASDLYHLGRVKRIYIRNEKDRTVFDFVENKLPTLAERAIAYLQWLGVPAEAVITVPVLDSALMSSLGEAQSFFDEIPQDTLAVVVVTSAPHTRRSLLCFQRSKPAGCSVSVYAASSPYDSSEIYFPIWHEYVKLMIYLAWG